MIKNEAHIIDENVEQMEKYGLKPSGEQIGEYSPTSKWIKQQKGQPSDSVRLHDTGEFHQGMFMKKVRESQKESEFEIKSADWKSDMLEREWGEIFGLTKENLKDFTHIFFEEFYDKLKLYFK